MKIKSEKDFWSGVMFIVVGIGFAWGATEYSFGSSARPGPAYFPFGLGLIMAALGALILVKALFVGAGEGDKFGSVAWKPLGVIVGSMVLFGFLLPWLGMFIALPALVVTSALAGDEFHWKEALINAVVITAFSWLVFIYGLNLVIPLWPKFVG